MQREGGRWLEVVSRMAVINFELVFRSSHQQLAVLPILLSTANYSHHFNELEHLTLTLFH